ncbi:MAG: DUF4386 domain-containing protein [Anaerolineae bacterium]
MNGNRFRLATAIILILTPVALLVFYAMLALYFEYPTILHQPPGYTFERVAAGGPFLAAVWYGLTVASVLVVPVVIMLHSFLSREDTPYMATATGIGVVGAVLQLLGLMRWPFLAPSLATAYLDPAASQAGRDAAAMVFQGFSQYAGISVGENLAYLFTSAWLLLASLAMVKSGWFKPWLGWLGIVPAIAIFVGIFQPLGLPQVTDVAFVGYILWAIWLLLAGLFLLPLRRSTAEQRPESAQPVTPLAPARAPRPAGGLKKGRSRSRRR